MSHSPRRAAATLVASSGRLVPSATTVSPITASETLARRAAATAPFTKSLAPKISIATDSSVSPAAVYQRIAGVSSASAASAAASAGSRRAL